MSGLDMDRLHDGGGGNLSLSIEDIDIAAQPNMLGDRDRSAVVDSTSTTSVHGVGIGGNPRISGGSGTSGTGSFGGGGSPREVQIQRIGGSPIRVGNSGGGGGGGGGGKRHRRLRRQFHQQQQHYHKKQNHGHNQHGNFGRGRRIRRNTQPAPNNTNEFLMQEHDHLFHLDFDNEDWEGSGGVAQTHHELNSTSATSTSPHSTNTGVGINQNQNHHHAFYSSSDDDQDYLQREFSATYDNVNAERLSSMTKTELISEYQMLQERVETLERNLKTALDSRAGPEIDHVAVNLLTLSDDDKLRLVQDEILKLRDENQKIKEANKYLRKLMYRGPLYVASSQGETDNENLMEFTGVDADQVSTDSGGGSGSVG